MYHRCLGRFDSIDLNVVYQYIVLMECAAVSDGSFPRCQIGFHTPPPKENTSDNAAVYIRMNLWGTDTMGTMVTHKFLL